MDATILKEIESIRTKWKSDLVGNDETDFKNRFIKQRINWNEKHADPVLNLMVQDDDHDYLWEDCKDYKTNLTSLSSMFSKVNAISFAYNYRTNKYYQNSQVKEKIIYCLKWIFERAYNKNKTIYGNSWSWTIGIPKILVNICILMYDQLDEDLRINLMSSIQNFLPKIDPVAQTGANLADICFIKLLEGAILNDDSIIEDASLKINKLFEYVKSGDGFYKDGSFIQHNKVAYTGSYGIVLISSLANLMYLIEKTRWKIKEISQENIIEWITNSFEPIVFKGYVMDLVRGRAVSRFDSNGFYATVGIIEAMLKIADGLNDPNKAEIYYSLIKNWQNEAIKIIDFGSKISSITITQDYYKIINNSKNDIKHKSIGHYAFNCMDKTVHKRDNFAFSVSRSSNRISKYEFMNFENVTPWFQGDGMTYLYNNDLNHYSDHYWPTIDPMRMPGTTINTRPRNELTGNTYKDNYKMSHADWSGGTKLDDYGICGVEIINKIIDKTTSSGVFNNFDNLNARKSWFFFDQEIVALGSGITSPDEFNIETIIENRKIKINNKMFVNGELIADNTNIKNQVYDAEWAFLEGNGPDSDIGYFFPTKTSIYILRENRTGKWMTINKSKDDGNIIRENTFLTMFIDHGRYPQNEKYCYAILPNKKLEEVEKYSQNPEFEIIRNDEIVHSVRHNTLKIEGANFWEHGPNKSGIITSYNKSSIVMKEDQDNTLIICVSDPTFKQSLIKFEIEKLAYEILFNHEKIINLNILNDSFSFEVDTENSNGASFKLILKV